MIRARLAATAALIGLCAGARAQDAGEKFTLPRISVTGEASEEVRPDEAELRLHVVSEQPTPVLAAQGNARSAAEVVAELKTLGIEGRDIRTEALSLAPLVVEERDPATHEVVRRTQTGYRATSGFVVHIRDVDKAGAVVIHVVEHGANTYDGLSFDVSDREARLDALRAKAVRDALRRAALYAGAASMKLGRLMAIDPEPDSREYADLPRARSAAAGPHPVEIPTEPGTTTLSARVTATWELVPE
jgi:uncharacterized protein YggE